MPLATSTESEPKTPTLRPLGERVASLAWLLGEVLAPVPDAWKVAPIASKGDASMGGTVTKCVSYRELTQAWRKALKWTDGLECALSGILASVLTTNLVGEQLWLLVCGPPSSGKTTILEGISTNKKYVTSKDTIRGFYSGYKVDSGEDVSLAAELGGKTLAMKEGDAFVKAPNIQQILSEGRGLYDRVGRNHYRSAVANEYEGLRMTWIICGTSAIREEIDTSELGARFLACVVMEEIEDEFEDGVLWRAVNSEARSMLVESNGDPRDQHPEELSEAMYLTGGYVGYLRENAADLISQVVVDEQTLRYCGKLGKFISYMRARPTKKDETQEREFGARLAKQMIRVAIALAAVTNKHRISDEDVMWRVKKIAHDTAKGATLSMARHMMMSPQGLEAKALELKTGLQNARVRTNIRFLRNIGAVEANTEPLRTGVKSGSARWQLTPRLRKLWEEVGIE